MDSEDLDFDVTAAFVYYKVQEENNKYICKKTPPPCPHKGNGQYYIWRFNNFMERHVDCSHEPPVYYYGPLETSAQIATFIKVVENKNYMIIPPLPYIPPFLWEWIVVNLPIIAKDISNTREKWLGLEQELVKHQKDVLPTFKGTPNISKSYGYKYCIAFGTLLLPKLTTLGQKWITNTLIFLQNYMEAGLVSKNWTAKNNFRFNWKYGLSSPTKRKKFYENVELSTTKFKDFAFATHPDAYLDAGLAYLPITDLIKIIFTPDFAEWKELDTIEQALIVFIRYIETQMRRVISKGKKVIKSIIDYITDQF